MYFFYITKINVNKYIYIINLFNMMIVFKEECYLLKFQNLNFKI